MAEFDPADAISLSDATRLGIEALVNSVEQGRERVILRDGQPVAAIISVQRLGEVRRLQDDLLDASLAVVRMLTTGTRRHSLDDVLAQFGFSREQLAGFPE